MNIVKRFVWSERDNGDNPKCIINMYEISKNKFINTNTILLIATSKWRWTLFRKYQSQASVKGMYFLKEPARNCGDPTNAWGPLLTHRFITACPFSISFLPFSFPTRDSQEVTVSQNHLLPFQNWTHLITTFYSLHHFPPRKRISLWWLCGLQAPCQRLHSPAFFLPDGVMWSPPVTKRGRQFSSKFRSREHTHTCYNQTGLTTLIQFLYSIYHSASLQSHFFWLEILCGNGSRGEKRKPHSLRDNRGESQNEKVWERRAGTKIKHLNMNRNEKQLVYKIARIQPLVTVLLCTWYWHCCRILVTNYEEPQEKRDNCPRLLRHQSLDTDPISNVLQVGGHHPSVHKTI